MNDARISDPLAEEELKDELGIDTSDSTDNEATEETEAVLTERVSFDEEEEETEAPGAVDMETYAAAEERAVEKASKQKGWVPISKNELLGKSKTYGSTIIENNGMGLVIDINMLRQELGLQPVVFVGQVFQTLPSPRKIVKVGGKEQTIDFNKGRNANLRPLTGHPVRTHDKEGRVVQRVLLTAINKVGDDGVTRPSYQIICPTAEGPVYMVPTAIWQYTDTNEWRIEAERSFSIKVSDFKGNNYDQVIGLVLQTLQKAGFDFKASTRVSYGSRAEHDAFRKRAVNGQNNDGDGPVNSAPVRRVREGAANPADLAKALA